MTTQAPNLNLGDPEPDGREAIPPLPAQQYSTKSSNGQAGNAGPAVAFHENVKPIRQPSTTRFEGYVVIPPRTCGG